MWSEEDKFRTLYNSPHISGYNKTHKNITVVVKKTNFCFSNVWSHLPQEGASHLKREVGSIFLEDLSTYLCCIMFTLPQSQLAIAQR